MVADAVIHHPAVSHYLRYVATTGTYSDCLLERYISLPQSVLTLSTTVGRDKILRTLQYFSRFYAWYLYRTNNPPAAIAPFTAIKTQFGLTRKIMRVGKFVEHFKAASELYDASARVRANGGDQVVQYLQILRQLGYGLYMTFDMLTVLDAAGIKKSARAKNLQQHAYKAWFVGLLASAIAGLYSNYQLMQRAKTIDEKDGEGKVEGKKIERYDTCFRRWDIDLGLTQLQAKSNHKHSAHF
jgi:peroxin-11B